HSRCLYSFPTRRSSDLDFQPPTNRLLTHGLMRAERDQDVERLRDITNVRVQRLKQESNRSGASAVRHNEQDALAAVCGLRTGRKDRKSTRLNSSHDQIS